MKIRHTFKAEVFNNSNNQFHQVEGVAEIPDNVPASHVKGHIRGEAAVQANRRNQTLNKVTEIDGQPN